MFNILTAYPVKISSICCAEKKVWPFLTVWGWPLFYWTYSSRNAMKTGYDFQFQGFSDVPVSVEIIHNSLKLRPSMIPNGASNHHAFCSSSMTLDNTLSNGPFTGIASNVDAAITVSKIKVGFIGKDKLLPIPTLMFLLTSHHTWTRLNRSFCVTWILYKRALARSLCYSRCQWIVGADNDTLLNSPKFCQLPWWRYMVYHCHADELFTILSWCNILSSIVRFLTHPVLLSPLLSHSHHCYSTGLHLICFCKLR